MRLRADDIRWRIHDTVATMVELAQLGALYGHTCVYFHHGGSVRTFTEPAEHAAYTAISDFTRAIDAGGRVRDGLVASAILRSEAVRRYADACRAWAAEVRS